MAKVIEALKGLNSYPIPLRTLVETAEKRGLNLDTETTAERKGIQPCRRRHLSVAVFRS